MLGFEAAYCRFLFLNVAGVGFDYKSAREFLSIILRALLPELVLKYSSLLSASFLEKKYSQNIKTRGLRKEVFVECP